VGAEKKIAWVEIRWLSGLSEKFEDLEVDKIHTLREGSGAKLAPAEAAAPPNQ
jgi:hypothetical protein